jgi:hypothetical protein
VHHEVRVQGIMDARWSAWFGGLRINADADGETTTISGPIRDQAALHGLLGKIRDLGLPLLEIRRIPPD